MAASSAVAKEPRQSLVLFFGSLISATHLPHVRCRTPRYSQEAFWGPPFPLVGPFFHGFKGDFLQVSMVLEKCARLCDSRRRPDCGDYRRRFPVHARFKSVALISSTILGSTRFTHCLFIFNFAFDLHFFLFDFANSIYLVVFLC